jgi:hypothetical protein
MCIHQHPWETYLIARVKHRIRKLNNASATNAIVMMQCSGIHFQHTGDAIGVLPAAW